MGCYGWCNKLITVWSSPNKQPSEVEQYVNECVQKMKGRLLYDPTNKKYESKIEDYIFKRD